jgi:multidrug resistance efflux pump
LSAAEPLRRWRTVGLFVILGVLLLLGTGIGAAKKTAAPAADPTAPGEKIAWAAAVAYVDVPGGVRYLFPEQPGRVTFVADEDKLLKKDAVVLRVDDEMAKVQVEQARLAVEAAKKRVEEAALQLEQHQRSVEMQEAAVEVAKSKRDVAQEQFTKTDRMVNVEKGSGRPEDVIIAKRAVDAAEAGVKAEEAQLALVKSKKKSILHAKESAELDVKAQEVQLRKADLVVRQCQVRAPCLGKVLRSAVSVGEVLGPTSKQPILWFCPDSDRIIRAEVEQEFAWRIEPGQKVEIEADTLGKPRRAQGTVKSVSDWSAPRRSTLQEPMQFNDVRTVEALIILDAAAQKEVATRIGLRVRVKATEK